MGSRVKPGIIQKRILERGKYFQFTELDDHDAVQIVNISGTYLLSMKCMLLSARTGNAYYTQLFNKWLFTLCLVQYGHGQWTMYTRFSVTF